MTFKKLFKESVKMGKRVERSQKRRARELANYEKEMDKAQQLSEIRTLVEKYDAYIYFLKNSHKDCNDAIDWQEVINDEIPNEPVYENTNEKIVSQKIANFKPSLLNKLFNTTHKQIERLEKDLQNAIQKDQIRYRNLIDEYNEMLSETNKLNNIARGIINKDIELYRQAIDYFNPFIDISDLGGNLDFSLSVNSATISIHIHGHDIIPTYILQTTSTGKLSKKALPKSRFIELYQDYVCSVCLKVVRETFALLSPIDTIIINAIADILNTTNGVNEPHPVLSFIVSRNQLSNINFDYIDPSDCVTGFKHTMKFNKTNGFSKITPLSNATLNDF